MPPKRANHRASGGRRATETPASSPPPEEAPAADSEAAAADSKAALSAATAPSAPSSSGAVHAFDAGASSSNEPAASSSSSAADPSASSSSGPALSSNRRDKSSNAAGASSSNEPSAALPQLKALNLTPSETSSSDPLAMVHAHIEKGDLDRAATAIAFLLKDCAPGAEKDELLYISAYIMLCKKSPSPKKMERLVLSCTTKAAAAKVYLLVAAAHLCKKPEAFLEMIPDAHGAVTKAMIVEPQPDTEGRRLKVAIENYFLVVETKHVHKRNIEKIRAFIRTMPGVTLEQALQYKGQQIGHSLVDPIFQLPSKLTPMQFLGKKIRPSRIHPKEPPAKLLQKYLEMESKESKLPFDGVIYINLKHREDRKQSILFQLQGLKVPIVRIDAVGDKRRPRRGSAMSHILAIQEAKKRNWERALILEDDARFYFANNARGAFAVATKCVEAIEKNEGGFDVLMLGGYIMACKETKQELYKRVILATMAHAYIVSKSYGMKLVECFRRAIKYDVQIDLMWFEEQQKRKWFISNPTLVGQIASESDLKMDKGLDMSVERIHKGYIDCYF